ncbi:MAG: Ig-like domain-containing protein, partial [Gammaproteobacteria bacterium]
GLSDAPLTVTLVNPTATLGAPTVTGSPGNAAAIRVDYAAGTALGTDSFGYRISDASGDVSSGTAFVAVTSSNVPIAADDVDVIFADEVSVVDVLDNDVGLADAPLSVTITSDPANGVVRGISNCSAPAALCEVHYLPDVGFDGTDSYQYMVTDSTSESSIATVTITVTEVPIAADDTVSTSQGQPVTVDVLANDTKLGFPPLTVAMVPNAAFRGTAVVQADNTIVYTPPGDSSTSDVFDYSVTDSNGRSSTARVSITVVLNQDELPGNSSAVGSIGVGLLTLLAWLRRRRR